MSSQRFTSYQEFVSWLLSVADRAVLEQDRVQADERTCRLPLILRQHTSLSDVLDAVDDPPCYGLLLMQAGRASVAVAQADIILVSKQIQKYMVRQSQGKAQLTYLQEKGKSLLGSRIRLRQSQQFFEEIDERLRLWSQDYDLEQVFLSCTPKLKGAFFLAIADPVLSKDDPRWRRVPFMVRPPGQVEMQRIHRLLCRAEWWD